VVRTIERIAVRCSYLAAAALVAAAVGDLLVESIANTGILGGHYSDRNHTSVLPTLLAGAIIALELVVLRVARTVRRSESRPGWLRTAAAQLRARRALADLPLVYALELGALFVMESIEQLLATGALPAGTAWLGGPVAFSLAAHALLALAATLALRWLIRALSATVASLILVAIAFVRLSRREARSAFCRRLDAPAVHQTPSPHLLRIGGRAPPLLLTTI
jgi:hypothetical protein